MTPNLEQITNHYNQETGAYDRGMRLMDRLGGNRLRRKVLQQAKGKILELAIGTGLNLAHYPKGSLVTGIDISKQALELAKERASKMAIDAKLLIMDAEKLDFPNQTFDTIVSTFSLCTIPNPVATLSEAKRVLKPGGQILLLEHGISSSGLIKKLQQWYAPIQLRRECCHLLRDPIALAQAGGLAVTHLQRSVFGTIYQLTLNK